MINIGIVGYGNLARGLEKAVAVSEDVRLCAVFTRRDPESLSLPAGVKAESMKNILDYKDKIDVMALCGGSATDLPVQGPEVLSAFNTVDSFDTHAKIPEYLKTMNNTGRAHGKLGIISVGWDPGLFSLMRAYFEAFLPNAETATFWGAGVSQGHSDALRRVSGVTAGVQYTVPKQDALEKVRAGNFDLSTKEKHLRECYVVVAEGADRAKIEKEIKTMPAYFLEYDTLVHFITAEELAKNHSAMPHGGFVIRSGTTYKENRQTLELSIKLGSNPEFTSQIMLSYIRANYRLAEKGKTGAMTVYDVAPKYLMAEGYEEMVRRLL
jgi:diaminopimelate dehydrogenase